MPTTDTSFPEEPTSPLKVIESTRLIKKLGAIYRLNDEYSLFAAYGEGFKMPTASQLYTTTVRSTPTTATVIQNPNLKPESAYVPLGSIVDAVAYPSGPDAFTHEQRQAVLEAVGLGHRLDVMLIDDETASGDLSGGELQRLALARLLLRPAFAYLDEPTSAIDVASEAELFALLRRELPDAAFIIVAHRKPQGLGTLRTIELGAVPAAPAASLEPALA